MDSGERGMNPLAMTIINPGKEYWPSRGSNQRPPVLNSTTLPTELLGSAYYGKSRKNWKPAFYPFPPMSSTLKLFSANAFNLEKAKIFSSD